METIEERLLREYFGKEPDKYDDAKNRLEKGEPLAYILGDTVFFDETYLVSPAVLIPRPDTERVVEKVLLHLPRGGRFLDLCTGSGCIAISALCHSEQTEAVLVDISEDALLVARENARRNGVYERCTFLCADLFDDVDFGSPYDVIVSNPPYVASNVVDTLETGCRYEPRIAFDGGNDGGDFYRRLLTLCPPFLKPGGKLIFEIGYDQRAFIINLAKEQGFDAEVYKDYGKNDRVAVLSKMNEGEEK